MPGVCRLRPRYLTSLSLSPSLDSTEMEIYFRTPDPARPRFSARIHTHARAYSTDTLRYTRCTRDFLENSRGSIAKARRFLARFIEFSLRDRRAQSRTGQRTRELIGNLDNRVYTRYRSLSYSGRHDRKLPVGLSELVTPRGYASQPTPKRRSDQQQRYAPSGTITSVTFEERVHRSLDQRASR